ncbi:MAG: hypothetical protein U1B80_03625, partial [Anaerolineaceae bacterium]|nr:hypothetical protein [Anaerolineaceae bacterium]
AQSSWMYWFGKQQRWVYPLLVAIGLGVALVYIWVLTAGKMTVWTPHSQYYDRLASSFLEGQASLLESPPSELLNLENPYDWRAREGIDYLWDVSLYDGKYYLYWGPVPALAALPYKILKLQPVEDQYLLLGFLIGSFISTTLLITAIWRRFFNAFSGLGVIAGAVLAGFCSPAIWMLSRPSVYEAVIASGQFWLMTAMLAAFLSTSSQKISVPGLGIAGVCFACAVGSRATLAPAVCFLAAMTLGFLFGIPMGGRDRLLRIAPAAIAFCIPLALGAAALVWYNLIRFGEPFEFGLRYQLTGPMSDVFPAAFSPVYILPNLYGYFLRLPLVEGGFPFLSAPFVSESMWPFFIRLPEDYFYHEPITGFLVAAPATLFSLIIIWGLPSLARRSRNRENGQLLRMILWMLGGFIFLIAPLMVYAFSTMRYQMDFMPFLIVLSVSGMWLSGFLRLSNRFWRSGLWIVFILAVLMTTLMGFLIGMSEPSSRFEAINPSLYRGLETFFNQWATN